ncbi:hypothetical protein E2C01_085179 [Portunus trituberculatus]|uniref:Uncharacterized protein n=1 Tax=Portunus trituberculatus TaxID=210409 RepID=A0A5B7J601_PORTR|nr:hypothetical protein [Portunus trituberculatus]
MKREILLPHTTPDANTSLPPRFFNPSQGTNEGKSSSLCLAASPSPFTSQAGRLFPARHLFIITPTREGTADLKPGGAHTLHAHMPMPRRLAISTHIHFPKPASQ